MRLREWLKASLAAGLAMGCSDPPPPAASAGLDMNVALAANPPSGTSCPRTATYLFGNPAPTPTDQGVPGTDGEQADQRITCSVRGEGTFQVSGAIDATALSFDDQMLTRVRFTLTNATVTAGATGTGSLSIFTPGLSLTSDPASLCTIDVSTPPLAVEPSRIWARYNCRMQDPPGQYCQVSGVMLFENCLTE
jgi:hypothetical protein